jgi:hypothetical protein
LGGRLTKWRCTLDGISSGIEAAQVGVRASVTRVRLSLPGVLSHSRDIIVVSDFGFLITEDNLYAVGIFILAVVSRLRRG